MIRAVLFDLDGVIRHFSPEHVAEIERRHGLDTGALEAVAFTEPVIGDVTTGRISRAEWVAHIGNKIGRVEAAEEWGQQSSRLDVGVLELNDEIRALGLTTAILTNGTDSIADEMTALGLTDRFDQIFNSAEIGYAKPDIRAFRHVLQTLGMHGPEVFFTDDSGPKLLGADAVQMRTHHYANVNALRSALTDAGVPIDIR
jgi:HAD superfamily hydrolase (TIGR01509 family)